MKATYQCATTTVAQKEGKTMAASKATANDKIVGLSVLTLAKETKNMYKFVADVENSVVGDVYISKSHFTSKPASITIQVSL